MKEFLSPILAFTVLSLVIGTAFASGIGTSSIAVNSTSVSVSAGNVASVAYTVKLTSGSPWGTTISATNAAALAADGIKLAFSDGYADPSYSGTLTISTSSSTPSGAYNISLAATGDDPSSSATTVVLTVAGAPSSSVPSTTTILPTKPSAFNVISKSTFAVNGTSGGNFTLNHVITAVIPSNTFVLENGNTIKEYNFSIIDFSTPASLSGPNSTLEPYGAYAFAVNGKINSSIEFVNSSGKPQPIKSIVVGGQNDTSWTFLGGSYNGTAYSGGKYSFADTWTHPTNSTMVNDVFFKPVMWVFLQPAVKATTTATTTVPPVVSKATTATTTVSAKPYPGSDEGVIGAIVVIIIIIALVAIFALRKKK